MRSPRDPTAALKEALATVKYSNLASVTEPMTGHGFRHLASTRLREKGCESQLIQRKLSHADRNAMHAAHNFAEYLPARRKMMQH